MLPQVNATLTAVSRGGYTEDYSRPADDPEPRVWQGTVDAYVQRKVRSGMNDQGGLQRALDVTIIIDDSIPVVPQAGDVLTYIFSSTQATRTGVVQNIGDPAELPAIADYYKCYLEEVGAS